MATDRFNKLKKEKKEKIFDGVKKVLREKAYEDVLATDIILASNISRGSFYTYFLDKRDAVKSLCFYESEKICDNFKSLLLKNEGDYFETVREIYRKAKDDVVLIFAEKFFANFAFISDIIFEIFDQKDVYRPFQEFNEWSRKHIAKNILRENVSNEIVEHINILCLHAVTNALTQLIRFKKRGKDLSLVDNGFEIELNIIKNGVMGV